MVKMLIPVNSIAHLYAYKLGDKVIDSNLYN